MKTTIPNLKPGTEFFFCADDLRGGVNTLTRFRRTAKGYTNMVTGENTRLSSSYASKSPVVDAASVNK